MTEAGDDTKPYKGGDYKRDASGNPTESALSYRCPKDVRRRINIAAAMMSAHSVGEWAICVLDREAKKVISRGRAPLEAEEEAIKKVRDGFQNSLRGALGEKDFNAPLDKDS